MPVILCIGCQKGGTGKSALVRHLAPALAELGVRVLAVDLDPQHTLTTWCAVDDSDGASMAEVIGGAQAGTLRIADIVRTVPPGFDLAPATVALATTELLLPGRLGREQVLQRTLAQVDKYDCVLLDCGPSLGLLTVNALTAADFVVIPTRPEAADLAGVSLFLDTIVRVRDALNPRLPLGGIVLTFCRPRWRHHAEGEATLREADLPVLQARIGQSVRVSESMGTQQSLFDYAPHNARAAEYRAVAAELWGRCGRVQGDADD